MVVTLHGVLNPPYTGNSQSVGYSPWGVKSSLHWELSEWWLLFIFNSVGVGDLKSGRLYPNDTMEWPMDRQ